MVNFLFFINYKMTKQQLRLQLLEQKLYISKQLRNIDYSKNMDNYFYLREIFLMLEADIDSLRKNNAVIKDITGNSN